jgi:uncharacterized protein (TIGR00255 family)
VEIRTVNNRFLKISSKISDSVSAIDSNIETIVREFLKRGSITVSLRVSRKGKNNAAVVNSQTLQSYVDQAKEIADRNGVAFSYNLGELLNLPGVLEVERIEDDEFLIEAAKKTLRDALQDLQIMRLQEGQAMATQFDVQLGQIIQLREQIELRAPIVNKDYRFKLEQRLRTVLSSLGHETTELDLLRETLLFADRTDISEELTRLASHLAQFRDAMAQTESQGRRLDFLIQEMFREVNTIGSKGNDSEISQSVVSIKTTIEQMRELVQNVE